MKAIHSKSFCDLKRKGISKFKIPKTQFRISPKLPGFSGFGKAKGVGLPLSAYGVFMVTLLFGLA